MVSPVVDSWVAVPVLLNRGGLGKLALVANVKCIDRSDVLANADVIKPILKFYGTRVTINMLAEQVEMFFAFARPRGKPPVASYFDCTDRVQCMYQFHTLT